MTLPSSGAISVAQINNELGRAGNAPFSFNGAVERGLAGKPSGKITLWDFYGKTMREPFSGDYYNGNTFWQVGRRAGSGWAMPDPVTIYWGGTQILVSTAAMGNTFTTYDHGGWRYHRSGYKQSLNCSGGKCEHFYGIYRVRL